MVAIIGHWYKEDVSEGYELLDIVAKEKAEERLKSIINKHEAIKWMWDEIRYKRSFDALDKLLTIDNMELSQDEWDFIHNHDFDIYKYFDSAFIVKKGMTIGSYEI